MAEEMPIGIKAEDFLENKQPRCKQTGYLVPTSRKAPIDGRYEASDNSRLDI
jgi:hypothetical protein